MYVGGVLTEVMICASINVLFLAWEVVLFPRII